MSLLFARVITNEPSASENLLINDLNLKLVGCKIVKLKLELYL